MVQNGYWAEWSRTTSFTSWRRQAVFGEDLLGSPGADGVTKDLPCTIKRHDSGAAQLCDVGASRASWRLAIGGLTTPVRDL